MKEPRAFVVEYDDFVYAKTSTGPKVVVLASGITPEVRTRFAIEALEECLGQLREHRATQEKQKQEHMKLFPHWYDADGHLSRPMPEGDAEDDHERRRYWHARGEAY